MNAVSVFVRHINVSVSVYRYTADSISAPFSHEVPAAVKFLKPLPVIIRYINVSLRIHCHTKQLSTKLTVAAAFTAPLTRVTKIHSQSSAISFQLL